MRKVLSLLGRARLGFRAFRRTRPFWAAVWMGLGGYFIEYLTLSPLHMQVHLGFGGVYGEACGFLLMLLALLIMFVPSQRMVTGVLAVVLGVVSFPLSNLGGLFVGMFLSVLGGCMAFGWMPEKPEKRRRLFRRVPAPALAVAPLTLTEPGVEA